MKCDGSNSIRFVSLESSKNKKAFCPFCKKDIKISIPDKRYSQTAKFAIHIKK